MTLDAKTTSRFDVALDEIKAIELLRGVVACKSITDNKSNFVDFFADEMRRRTLASQTEECLPGGPNIWRSRF